MNRRALIALLLATPLPALAQGHGAGGHAHGKGPNGGQIGEIGDRHAEMVARDGELRLYVLDAQDRPTSARGATGTAIVQAAGRQQTLRFEPGPGDAYLVARGEFAAAKGLRVVANVALPGQPPRQARFTPAD